MEKINSEESMFFINNDVNIVDIDKKIKRSYQFVYNIVDKFSESEAYNALQRSTSEDQSNEDILLGLLGIILTEPTLAAKTVRLLIKVSQGNLETVLSLLTKSFLDHFVILRYVVRVQIIWFTRALIHKNAKNMDQLCHLLLRQAAGGDTSVINIGFTESLLDMLQGIKLWLDKYPMLIGNIVYTFLRLIQDHMTPSLISLRKKESTFLVELIRSRFANCLVIGRDFIRLLRSVNTIPEFNKLWEDIFQSPTSLSPLFTDVLQLLRTKTPSQFLQSRLTVAMERNLWHLMTEENFETHVHFRDWFQRQYLGTPESETLLCDLIRFVISALSSVYKIPSNITPYWTVVGWLFNLCVSPKIVSNAQLALFYDWLFFNPEADDILSIEPAILLIHHSMDSSPTVSITLLTFLCQIIDKFYEPLTESIRISVISSLRHILEKDVLPSLIPIFDNPILDKHLRSNIRSIFTEFFDAQSLNAASSNEKNNQQTVLKSSDTNDDDKILSDLISIKEKHEKFKFNVLRFCIESDNKVKCKILDEILKCIIQENYQPESMDTLTVSLSKASSNFDDELPINDENYDFLDDITSPLFVLFKHLYYLCLNQDNKKEILIKLLADIYQTVPKTGYLLLYFLKVWGAKNLILQGKSVTFVTIEGSIYEEFCKGTKMKLGASLCKDLKQCASKKADVLVWLLPDIFVKFNQAAVNNAKILVIFLSVVNSLQLLDIGLNISMNNYIMLKGRNVLQVVKASLDWDTFKQLSLWQIIQHHKIQIENLLPIITQTNEKDNAEVMTSLLLILKDQKPTAKIMKYLFSSDANSNKLFITSIMAHWCKEYLNELGEAIFCLIKTHEPFDLPKTNKKTSKKRNDKRNSRMPPLNQILEHLEQFRQYCSNDECCNCFRMFYLDTVQCVLQHGLRNSTVVQKNHFSDLFTMTKKDKVHIRPLRQRKSIDLYKPVVDSSDSDD